MIEELRLAKKETILICRDGTESSQYATMLNKIGVKSFYLIGGIENWNHSLYHPSYLIDEKFS